MVAKAKTKKQYNTNGGVLEFRVAMMFTHKRPIFHYKA